ncbi:MAG: SDR family NAD(P)-dependent oxidoreductase [Polyangiales bacterium]
MDAPRPGVAVSAAPPTPARRALRAAAWAALGLSFPVWFSAFAAPLLPLGAGQKAAFAAACIAAGEALFWGAGLVLGAEVIARFRGRRVATGASFAGRRVAVIGATGGLGAAVARAVVREGGAVVLLARDASRLRPLADELGAPSAVTDLTPSSLRAAAAACGAVDHVVCATGVDVRRALADHSDGDVASQLDVALAGPVHVARAFLGSLREGGTIALFGGFADGTLALPYYSVDVAARAGLAGFCAAVNQELAVEGRAERLCYVGPAPADTEAERPFAPLWRKMGTAMAPPARVADFVLAALLARRTVAVMGRSTRLLARLRALAPAAVDGLVARRVGPALREAFARPEERGASPP